MPSEQDIIKFKEGLEIKDLDKIKEDIDLNRYSDWKMKIASRHIIDHQAKQEISYRERELKYRKGTFIISILAFIVSAAALVISLVTDLF